VVIMDECFILLLILLFVVGNIISDFTIPDTCARESLFKRAQ
jgi:hypothetical protein